ncbi:group III truncated hemoglobin [Sporocytophaga myxococcoides]|uniref:group III truncated hemoglobin n=1 Tax=Sporocytophaga myxococcoides TaxID=153721 RepID=UPI00042492DE|nr:group III truncated hemoglobin [Sporocytophaga myxococcoides]
MNDISNKEDIKTLVDRFYDKVNSDELLSPIFNDHAEVDWPKHLPTMYDFWNSLLLGSMEYKGQPFPKHMNLPVTKEHFERWIQLFTATLEENFTGPKADEALARAMNIARVFMSKMGLL